MRRASLISAVLATFTASVPAGALAESIADAWRMARQADASFAAAESESAAADSAQVAAERQRWPILRVTGSYSQLNESPALDISTPTGEFRSPKIWKNDLVGLASAEVAIPLWTAGRLSGAIGSARDEARAAAAQVRGAGANLELAVVEAYLGVLRARSAFAVAESNAKSLEAHGGAVRVMYEKESVPRSDLLAAQVALANAHQQRLSAANRVRLATAAYNRRVGQPLDRVPELDDLSNASAADGAPAIPGSSALTAMALERRPELEAIAARSAALEQAAGAARAERWPQLQLRAGYDYFQNQILDRQNTAMVGIGFEWRLFDSGQTDARAGALRHRARAAARQLEDARSLVALEVETAALNLEEAKARIAVAAEAVEEAEENLRMARELYGSGLGTNTQVLDAESLRIGALTNRDNARYDLQLARYQLRHATGAR